MDDLSGAANAFCTIAREIKVLVCAKMFCFGIKMLDFLGALSKTLFRTWDFDVLCCEMFKSGTFSAQDTSTFLIKPLASTQHPAIGARCASDRSHLICKEISQDCTLDVLFTCCLQE